MKSDFSIFGGFYLGILIGAFGCFVGLFMAFVRGYYSGLLIAIGSIFLGKYIIFKARRRKGKILYYGGRI
jgi:hypothetical protein